MKHCQSCKTTEGPFVINSTQTNKAGVTRTYYMCNACGSKRHASWYEKNKEKQLGYNRAYTERKRQAAKLA